MNGKNKNGIEDIIIKKEFDHSYLLFPMEEEKREEYSYQMIIQNEIPGVVNCQVRYVEDKPYYSYEISMKRSLVQEYSDKKLKYADMKELFINLAGVLKKASEFLLEREGFLLDPEYIYMDWDSDPLQCVYLPVKDYMGKDENRYRKMADFLLDRTDYKDEHAVNASYQFYKMSKEEFFSFEAFIGFMEKEDLMMQAQERRRDEKKETLKEESTLEKEEDAEINEWTEQKTKMDLKAPGILFIIGILFILSYRFIPSLKSYAFFILILGLVFLLLSVFLVVSILYHTFFKDRQEKEMQLQEEVTVEEYFDDAFDNETVFFDEESMMCLKWKEGHFSREYVLSSFPVTVGKLKESVQIRIEDDSISRLHARFAKQEEEIILQDLDSTNGTWVNGKKLFPGEEMIIHRNDEIQFGKIIVNVV